MNKAISGLLLILGVILIGWGVSASPSLGSDVSRLMTGTPVEEGLWVPASGAVAMVVGLVRLFQRSTAA